jgi:hypothetical protein
MDMINSGFLQTIPVFFVVFSEDPHSRLDCDRRADKRPSIASAGATYFGQGSFLFASMKLVIPPRRPQAQPFENPAPRKDAFPKSATLFFFVDLVDLLRSAVIEAVGM